MCRFVELGSLCAPALQEASLTIVVTKRFESLSDFDSFVSLVQTLLSHEVPVSGLVIGRSEGRTASVGGSALQGFPCILPVCALA